MVCTDFYPILPWIQELVGPFSCLYGDLSLEYGCEVWNSNKCQAKALESIQLHARKYILGCFVATGAEPVRADLGVKTLRYRRDSHKLKRYC